MLRGVAGFSPLIAPAALHGDCGRGRSSETRPTFAVCAISRGRNLGCDSLGDGTLSLEDLAFFKASKCDRREETGR
jgi:hypothetical protein